MKRIEIISRADVVETIVLVHNLIMFLEKIPKIHEVVLIIASEVIVEVVVDQICRYATITAKTVTIL